MGLSIPMLQPLINRNTSPMLTKKGTASFTKSASLVLIGQILKKIQPLKNWKNVQRNVLPDICFKDTPLNWPCSAFKLCDVLFKKRVLTPYNTRLRVFLNGFIICEIDQLILALAFRCGVILVQKIGR